MSSNEVLHDLISIYTSYTLTIFLLDVQRVSFSDANINSTAAGPVRAAVSAFCNAIQA